MSLWLDVIRVSCSVAIVAWLLSAIFIQQVKTSLPPENRGLRAARWIFHELKPFFVAMAITRFGIWCMDLSPWLWIHAGVFGLDYMNWRLYKDVDSDDDRWQRRKQKALDKITITDGKLAVIPA